MKRRLLNLLTVLSLVLLAVVIAALLASPFARFGLFVGWGSSEYCVITHERVLIVGREVAAQPLERPLRVMLDERAPTDGNETITGFGSTRVQNWGGLGVSGGLSWWERYWFPYWALAIVLAVLPAWRVISIMRRRRRAPSGLCPACGYDLRATPDRCAECGASPTPPA